MALGEEWGWFNAGKKLATTETALGGIPLGWNCHLSLSESCFLRVPNGSHSFPEKVVLKKRQKYLCEEYPWKNTGSNYFW